MDTYETWRTHINIAISPELAKLLVSQGLDPKEEVNNALRTVYNTMVQPLLKK